MATRAPSADAVRASSEMFTVLSHQNRRALLGASLAGVVALAATASSAAALPLPAITLTDTGPWDRAVAAFESARLSADRYHAQVLTPAFDTVDRAAPRPDLWFEVTAASGATARFDLWPADLHAFDDHPLPVFREKAGAVREAWAAHQTARASAGLDRIGAEADRLTEAQNDREADAMLTPAPHVAGLLWKLEELFGAGGGAGCEGYVAAVMADARRLLRG